MWAPLATGRMKTISLPPEVWQPRQAAHLERARRHTEPHLARRTRGQAHPVWDFLFDYYPIRASQLERWHPGLGFSLLDAPVNATFDPTAFLTKRRGDMERIRKLLGAVASRQPTFDCFGMHEWAMVYRDTPRHDLPLRLSRAETYAVVEAHQLKCSHFDAYRFFTPAAKPLNLTVLTREDQVARDQAGCVHVTMDLYKWAAKMGPVVPGELLLDAFELAAKARTLDMEASPYDCQELGFGVVPVETSEGKAQYVAKQRALAAEAAPIRDQLIRLLDALLTNAPGD